MPSVTKQLIAARYNVDLQDNDGATALHVEAVKGHAFVTQQLIEARCNVDLPGEGWVHAAIHRGQKRACVRHEAAN